MEASGYFAAASTFFTTSQIHCLKIVSDTLSCGMLSKEYVTELVSKHAKQVTEFLFSNGSRFSEKHVALSELDYEILQSISACLQLTVSQQHILKEAALGFKLRTGDSLEVLNTYCKNPVESKRHAKQSFEHIKTTLKAS